jgi:hypothetical protein
MKKNIWVILIIATLLFAGCAAKSAANQVDSLVRDEKVYAPPAAEMPVMEEAASTGGDYETDTTVGQDRIVIRNADLSIVVVDPIKSQTAISKMADDMKGYVVNSYLYKVQTGEGLEVPEVSITIRVPSDKLDEAIEKIKAEVENPETDILTEQVSGQDITMEYTDLQSRLKNLEATRDQLMVFMDEAKTTEEVMMVYNQLVSINEQIEVLKGQIKYYDESSKLSAITVRIQAQAAIQPVTIGKWQPVGVARDAVQALIKAFKFLVNAAIWIAIFVLPIALVIYLVVRLIIWIIRKVFKRKPKSPKNSSQIPPASQTPIPPQG